MNRPVWIEEKEKLEFSRLTKSLKTDVIVIGGGLAGVFTAYLLAKAGKKVVLIEKDNVGGGQTSYTTAFITYVVDTPLTKLAERFGEERARLIWEAGRTAIAQIERVVQDERIECDFLRCSGYEFAVKKEDGVLLEKESEYGRRLGFDVCYRTHGDLGFENFGYLEIASQAKFHPLKFLYQLAKVARGLGVMIFEGSEVVDIEGRAPIRVKTERGIVESEFVVVDTYNPISFNILPLELIPFQSYVMSLLVGRDVLEEAIYWDTQKPYNYFRLDKLRDFDRLILGGRDHLTGQGKNPQEYFDELEEYFKKFFKGVEYKIENTWTGEILEPADGVAYIGRSLLSSSVLVSTGFSGNGMTYSAISAMINRDIIIGRENKYRELFDPDRIGGIEEIVIHGINYVKQIARRSFLKAPEFGKEKILRNSGKVVEIEGKKVAVYRDERGKIYKLSPVCTHLGCGVNWNDVTKSWDCPCHGSRFGKYGNVLNGPARKPLAKIQ